MVITDPSKALLSLGVCGRLVYTLCHVHNSRVQQELHTKQHHRGGKRRWGAAEGCAFVVLCAIFLLDAWVVHMAERIHQPTMYTKD